ncbi:MAG: PKD domain-containing protein, partial [Chloroflexota bacterium]|nr:PKD domain-containing protein [Chloroflexota bacterium]
MNTHHYIRSLFPRIALTLVLLLTAVSTGAPALHAADPGTQMANESDIRLDVDEPIIEDTANETTDGSSTELNNLDSCAICPAATDNTSDGYAEILSDDDRIELLNIGISNPAAMYCEELGYEYKVVLTDEGEQGVCSLPNGEEVDAWAFYKGEVGQEFSYCAQQGLDIAPQMERDSFAQECITCVMDDGSSRTASELLSLERKITFGVQEFDTNIERLNTTNDEERTLEVTTTSIPDYFDWRNNGGDWLTPVRNQGGCGSCWAFAAVGIVEAQYNIFSGNPQLDLDLSEQYLVSDCSPNCGDCGGGGPACALGFIRDQGITDEACLPYIASNSPCSGLCPDWSERLYTIDERGYVQNNIQAIRESVIEEGPLVVAMGIGSKFGGYWDGDIYRCTNDNGANHAVVIVGYDETDNYWIVRNSWGSGFGDGGYFKVGCEECWIENYVYSAKLLPNNPPVANPGGPYSGTEDVAITFDGSASYDPSGDPLTYTWNFGDGTPPLTVASPTAEHTYTTGQQEADEVYSVTLTVNDGRADSEPVTTTVTVSGVNDQPTAEAGGPYSATLEQAITFNGSASSDEEGTLASYTWDFGDDTPPVTVTSPTVSHAYSSPGNYLVQLIVEDSDGTTDTDDTTAQVTVEPVELFSDSFEDYSLSNWVQDYQNDWFRSVQRATNGSYSAEVDGRATDATLTLKNPVDLSAASEATLTFSWFIEGGLDTGEYIALDLWNGASWNETVRLRGNVDLENAWHTESIDLGNYLTSDLKLRFRGMMSYSTEDANVDAVRITAILPPNDPPVADPGGPYSGTEDVAITFDGSASSDPQGTALTYTWDFGDGTPPLTVDTPTAEHTYTTGQQGVDEVYSVTLTVNDGRANSEPVTTTATVSGINDQPIADAGGPYSAFLGQTITFNGFASSDEETPIPYDTEDLGDEEGPIASYTWDFGDDTPPVTVTSPTVSHAYSNPGNYLVQLIVMDS